MADPMNADASGPPGQARIVRAIFAAMALLSLLGGLAFYLLAERLGVESTTARLVASAFLITAVLDALVLYAWDRLFKPGK
ncbi:MAG: hypothetical protein ACM31O_17200 [Bacteroidota bacterium]|jgi:hypothetical protein